MIEFKNVEVEFKEKNKKFKAVDNVTFKINDGEIFGIVGSSGSGKSTLLRTINLLQDVTKGEVLIDGADIVDYKGEKLRNLRQNIGMIFQHFNLAESRTVYKNIEFVLKEAKKIKEQTDKKIIELLRFVGLENKASEYPARLSGGQKQRVAIARALANDTKILLCDEPTSALDLETTASVLKLLKKINRELGITIVIITHELEVVKEICDRVAVMNHGNVIELGSVYDVFTHPENEFTRQLINHTNKFDIPQRVIDEADGSIVKLTYLDESAQEALISQASSFFKAKFNILHGKIEYIGERPVGILYVNVAGENRVINDAIKYLDEKTESLEVIKYA